MKAAARSNFLRPKVSASAPEGTSSKKMAAAQTALKVRNCSRLSPRSKKRMAKMG